MTQTEQLDDFLAREVMGWRLGKVEAGEYVWEDENYHIYYYAKPYDNLPERMFWHPTTDIAQALMCAEKWCNDIGCAITCTYVSVSKTWTVELDAWDIRYSIENEKQSLAISLALYEAVKGGE